MIRFDNERIVNVYKKEKLRKRNQDTELLSMELVLKTKIDPEEFHKKKVYFMRITDLDRIVF